MQGLSPHIFYTDDDEDDQELFRGALTEIDESLVLTTTDDGDQLLELLALHSPIPRIIFLDLNMPRRDGYETLQRLRNNDSLKQYPIVVFSTTSDPTAVRRTQEMGASLFVPKPYTYDGMKQAIRTCINMDWHHFKKGGQPFLMRFN